MKRRLNFRTLAWALMGLLALSAFMLYLGERESVANPDSLSYAPSGTRAFAELLEQEGYRVVSTRQSRPQLAPEDLAIGFLVQQAPNPFGGPVQGPETISPLSKHLAEHLSKGGRALFFAVPHDFTTGSRQSETPQQVSFDPSYFKGVPAMNILAKRADVQPVDRIMVAGESSLELAETGAGTEVFRLGSPGEGVYGLVSAGMAVTNRFLDQADNAEFGLLTVRTLMPEKGRIVFADAFLGDAVDPGLLRTLGTWAYAVWWQIVLVLLVIGYTLGRRFGLPEVDRVVQRSGRELVDAYAEVLNRARKPAFALQTIVREVDRDVRRQYNVPVDAAPARRNECLPDSLAKALGRAEIASQEPEIPDLHAAKLLLDLERELGRTDKTKPRRRRKR